MYAKNQSLIFSFLLVVCQQVFALLSFFIKGTDVPRILQLHWNPNVCRHGCTILFLLWPVSGWSNAFGVMTTDILEFVALGKPA